MYNIYIYIYIYTCMCGSADTLFSSHPRPVFWHHPQGMLPWRMDRPWWCLVHGPPTSYQNDMEVHGCFNQGQLNPSVQVFQYVHLLENKISYCIYIYIHVLWHGLHCRQMGIGEWRFTLGNWRVKIILFRAEFWSPLSGSVHITATREPSVHMGHLAKTLRGCGRGQITRTYF